MSSKRGGKREGAGRKKGEGEVRKVRTLRATDEEWAKIMAILPDIRSGKASGAVPGILSEWYLLSPNLALDSARQAVENIKNRERRRKEEQEEEERYRRMLEREKELMDKMKDFNI